LLSAPGCKAKHSDGLHFLWEPVTRHRFYRRKHHAPFTRTRVSNGNAVNGYTPFAGHRLRVPCSAVKFRYIHKLYRAPSPRKTAGSVKTIIRRSSHSDQFSM